MTGAMIAMRRRAGHALSWVRAAPYMSKWLVLGTMIGVVAGAGATIFFEGLRLATQLLLTDLGGFTPAKTIGEGGFAPASGFSRPWAIPLVVGLGGLISGMLVFRFAPEAEGHGTDAAIHAVHTNPKGVRPRVIGIKLLASAITIGSGGSGGREGPTAQISSGFGSVMARVLNLTPDDSRICVAAGVAAGIGAIFRAPFGGALLGIELLYTDDVEIDALVPSLIATVVGYAIFCAATGNWAPVFGTHPDIQAVHLTGLLPFIVVGLACGVVGKLYTRCFYGTGDIFKRWNVPRALKPTVGGVLVGLIGLAIPGVLGTGYGELQGQMILTHLLSMPWLVLLLLPLAKILATSLSIGSGGSGGIFGPGMVIGGATGALLWRLGHLAGIAPNDHLGFVIVGMAACFAAVAHAPIAVLVMVVEMTGSLALLPAATVAMAFAMVIVGETTIYRSQLRRRSDSPARRFDLRLAGSAVTEIMSAPRVVLDGALTVSEALSRLQSAGVPGAPVVNGDRTFLGTVERAGLDAAAADGAGAAAVGALALPEAITLPVEAGLDAALQALPSSNGGWVPVLDDAMRVAGIISAHELLIGVRATLRESWSEILGAVAWTTLIGGTVATGAPADGHTIAELGLPHGTVVLSSTRRDAVTFPGAGYELRAGDFVSVAASPDHADEVRTAFGCG